MHLIALDRPWVCPAVSPMSISSPDPTQSLNPHITPDFAQDPDQLRSGTPARAIAVFDIDGVVRDVSRSYRRAIADTVEHFTQGAFRPSMDDIDRLKSEGIWNNDWLGSQELTYRYFEGQGQSRQSIALDYDQVVDYFQRQYRGQILTDPDRWDGYINQEPLLMERDYLQGLARAGIAWGFFSGATRGSAEYILQRRMGLAAPPLVAMGEAPDKPDPQGLFQVVATLETVLRLPPHLPVIYAGDTVADLYTIAEARLQRADRPWLAVGVLPPHVWEPADRRQAYGQRLRDAGADRLVDRITDLTPGAILSMP